MKNESMLERFPGIRAAIFDVDGTLLDSMPIWEDAGEKYLHTLGITARPGLGKVLFPMSMEEAAVYMREEYRLPCTAAEIVAGVAQTIDAFYREEVLLKDGAEGLLSSLASRGVKLAVATSGNRALCEAAFTRLGVRNYFSGIFTCSEVGAGKSRPDIFLRAAQFLGSEPAETWVFEDALHAIETAKKAGFPVAAIYDKSNESQMDRIKEISDVYLEIY